MIEYDTFTLANGLRVVHNFDPTTAMVAVDVLYDTGSRDEDDSLTGLAHLMEHLMFAGSENAPSFDEEMERAGGTNNAWTSPDFTNYYDVAPAVNFETLLFLESDRMGRLRLDREHLEVQRAVVIEEFKQRHLSQPYGNFDHELRALAFTRHPYRHPTIGAEVSHIERITLSDVRRFYAERYSPANAVLAISGNVSLDEARRGVERWFGQLPSRPVKPHTYPQEPPQTAPRRAVVYGRVPQARIVVAFPMGGYFSPFYPASDLVTDILASGRSSRYFRRLVMGSELFTMADASISGSEDSGLLMLRGELSDASPESLDRACEMLVSEARELCHAASPDHPDGVSERELTSAKNRHATQTAFGLTTCADRALALALAEIHGEDINAQEERYQRVTLDTLTASCREILRPDHASTLLYLPEK